jgi:hypothetical protein
VLAAGVAAACSPGPAAAAGQAIRLGIVDAKQLQEISGIAASRRHPGVLWVHNDGSDKRLFAVSTNGQVVGVFELPKKPDDVEDIAMGPLGAAGAEIYLGDVGDNERQRSTVRVFRFLEPDLEPGARARKPVPIASVEIISLRYPDRPQDAEALLVDPQTGELLIATKLGRSSRIYRAAKERVVPGPIVPLQFVREIPFGDISGGDVSPDGTQIILRRENAAWVWSRAQGEDWGAAFARVPRAVAVVGLPREPNGESVAFHPAGGAYYTLSEGKRQPIYLFQLPR